MIEVKMPSYGWTETEATIVQWLKKEGDMVKAEEPLLQIETEKVQVEVQAIKAGVLRKIMAPEGAKVAVGEVIAIMDEYG